MHYRLPHPGQGILGPVPAIYSSQSTTLRSAFSIMPPQDPTWHIDTGASSHLNFNASNLSTIFDKRLFPSVHVGDGKSIPVTNTGHSTIPSHHHPLHLHNVLVTPNIIKNLIYVRQFTRDNNCTIEFDAFGFSVKDYFTRHILIRCDSSGDLYPVTSRQLLLFLFSQQVLPRSINASDIRVIKCVKMVHSMWLFKHKFHACGTLYRYKARLVANGSGQQLDVDFDETFSPVVKPDTVRTVLSLVVSHDIILTASCPALLQQIIGSLNNEFDMTDLGALNYFLSISTDRTPTGLFLSHKKYALQLIERAHIVTCNPSRTPIDTESKLGPEGVPVQDPTLYRSLAWGHQYLILTRPYLSYAVQQICLYMHDPREPHFATLKRILRYVRGTMDFGLQLYVSATTSLVGYTDADWAGFSSTRSAEAEYLGVANVVAETAWIRNLLRELHSSLSTATLVYCDNVSAVYMSANPVQHQQMKHIEIDIHFVCDMVTAGHVRVLHVPSRFQYADIFTKGLSTALFEDIRSNLSVRPPPAQTAGAY
ncbi:ribonuclease H-like domain-containing protein [Tanacetum coccineum]